MRFGEIRSYKSNPDGSEEHTIKKYRDYNEYSSYTEFKQRVQIMRVSDFDTIVQQMHIEHALQDHGAYLEHGKDGKLYVIKHWIEKNTLDS